MRLWEWWRDFRTKRARDREARRHLAALFDRLDLRRISSLRAEHRSRAVLLDFEAEDDRIVRIRFGIVRHPQPVAVRGVHDEVIEIYVYDVRAGTVEVAASRNITRKGRPAP
jgi:hypothetical protein